jgi:hypothetical protein
MSIPFFKKVEKNFAIFFCLKKGSAALIAGRAFGV